MFYRQLRRYIRFFKFTTISNTLRASENLWWKCIPRTVSAVRLPSPDRWNRNHLIVFIPSIDLSFVWSPSHSHLRPSSRFHRTAWAIARRLLSGTSLHRCERTKWKRKYGSFRCLQGGIPTWSLTPPCRGRLCYIICSFDNQAYVQTQQYVIKPLSCGD